MKKVLTILVILTIIVGAAFASTEEKIVLTSDSAKYEPVLLLQSIGGSGSESGSKAGDKTGNDAFSSSAGTEIATGLDIAAEDITWNVEIYQDGGKKGTAEKDYAKMKGTVTLDVTASAFTMTADNVTYTEKDAPTVTRSSIETVVAGNKRTEGATSVPTLVIATNGTTGVKLTYKGKVIDQKIASYSIKWTADDTLPDGTYKADVKLTYTVG